METIIPVRAWNGKHRWTVKLQERDHSLGPAQDRVAQAIGIIAVRIIQRVMQPA